MKQLKYTHYILFFVLLYSSHMVLKGQSSTMYYMGAVPQSYYLNPATQPQCGFFIGLPGASPARFEYKNTGLSVSDFIFKDENSDSVLHLFHPSANINDFVDQLKDVEHIGLSGGVNLASFGFRVQDMFFSLDASIKVTGNINYPKSLFDFLLIGNTNNQTFDLSPLEFNAMAYTEIGINVSKSFGDMLSIGIRPKILTGIATISNSNEEFLLTTGYDEWSVRANTELRIAAAGTTFPLDEDGVIDTDANIDLGYDIIENGNYKAAFKNKGLGIDLGAHFRPYDEIQFSVSLLDIGYINWKHNTHVASFSGSTSFTGVDLEADSINFESIFDTIVDGLTATGSNNTAFKTGLTPKLILGGRFFLSEGFDVGLLSTTNFYKNRTTQDLTIVANLHPANSLGISGSYTITGKGHNTIGLGLASRLGPFNLYIISDYVPLYYDMVHITPDPDSEGNIAPPVNAPLPITYNFNIKIGFNLIFGCRKYKRLSQDKPLYNSSEWMF